MLWYDANSDEALERIDELKKMLRAIPAYNTKEREKANQDRDVYFYERDVHNDEPYKHTLKGWSIKKARQSFIFLKLPLKMGRYYRKNL